VPLPSPALLAAAPSAGPPLTLAGALKEADALPGAAGALHDAALAVASSNVEAAEAPPVGAPVGLGASVALLLPDLAALALGGGLDDSKGVSDAPPLAAPLPKGEGGGDGDAGVEPLEEGSPVAAADALKEGAPEAAASAVASPLAVKPAEEVPSGVAVAHTVGLEASEAVAVGGGDVEGSPVAVA